LSDSFRHPASLIQAPLSLLGARIADALEKSEGIKYGDKEKNTADKTVNGPFK
jgi:hypothetical protein